MSITRDFKLSLVAGRSVPLVINANQYDDGEIWRFTLLDENGQKYSPSTGSIIGLKSDGHIIANAGTVSSTGLVIIAETEQMTAAVGKNFYELLIDDDTHGTANFTVFVEPRPGAGGTPSDSDLAVFQEAIDAAATIGDVVDLVDDVAVLEARMDEFTTLTDGSTTGDAELADIRVGADGTTYPNAGDAVRGQVSDLKNAITNVIANTGFTVGGVKAITPATQNMFEKTIFSEDVGHAPQGLAVYGNIAYVSNGATYPLNVINEIDLTSGTFTTHTVSGLTYGANSLAIDPVNGLLYAAEHNNGGKVFAIDISTWQITETKTLPSEISSLANNGWNIVYDSSDQSFYNYSNKEYKIYKLNADFEIIETINIVADDDKFPNAKPGVTQGFGYDGTYFYIPRSEVYDVYGNSFMFVVDKSGKIIKYVRGCHDEIEEYAYDFSTGKSYACYALSASGYITEFVTDSGWIAINDYLSDNYQSKTTPAKIDFENTDAKFRIRDGVIYFNGKIKVINNNGTLCYLDGRIAPMNDIYTVVPVTETATYASQHDTAKLNLSATTYWSPDFTYKYVPVLNKPTINGYWWLDGVSAPLGRY